MPHRRAVRMGQHVWLLLATVVTELLVIFKWSKGQFSFSFLAHPPSLLSAHLSNPFSILNLFMCI
jgi:hypothetical protein